VSGVNNLHLYDSSTGSFVYLAHILWSLHRPCYVAADSALCANMHSAMSQGPHVLFQYMVVNVRVSLIFKETAGTGFLLLAGTII
jgi:hypothetical protein